MKLLLILLIVVSINANAQKYINPMDIPMVLSASFCELRPNHFHAGIDISTPRTGIPVKSVADGYVSRIKVSPYGYGYGLYITHYDGHTTVYGHLSEYAPKIDSVIRSEQYKLQSFEVDYFPDMSQLPVKEGEIVAFSGNTGGSMGPHLHFEVRDTKTDEALNPLAYLEHQVPDHSAPTIYGVKVYAMDDTSSVVEKYYMLKLIENKSIDACGHIGFGINTVDFFDEGGRPCGVVEVSLFDNNNLVFRSLIDKMPFDKSRYINSMVDYAEVQSNNRYIQKSFVEPNNRLDIFKTNNPIVVKKGEKHNIRYELRDFAGNVRKMSFTVNGAEPSGVNNQKSHNGVKLEWAHDYNVYKPGMSGSIAAGNFYKDEYIVVSKEDSSSFHRPLYTIGSREIPIHDNISLNISVPDKYKKLLADSSINNKQIFIARVGKKNTLAYLGGTLDNDVISAKSRFLGKFLIAIDTVAPRVVSKNSTTILSQSNSVMIGISDNFSGIAKYNCFIDGEWKIFEFDYKNARLISPVKKLNLASGAHTLVAKIEDSCGNETVWEWKFRIK